MHFWPSVLEAMNAAKDDALETGAGGMRLETATDNKRPLDPDRAKRIHLPASFRNSVHQILHPGASMMVTDAAVTETTTGVPLKVITGDPQTLADNR